MTEMSPPDVFAVISLCISALTALAVVVLAFLGSRTSRELRAYVDDTLARAAEAFEAVQPEKIQDALSRFEASIVSRVQKTERAFVTLGEEVTEGLDRADQLRRIASAKESRAKTRQRRLDQREDDNLGNGEDMTAGEWWLRSDLSDEQKELLAIQHLRNRGVNV